MLVQDRGAVSYRELRNRVQALRDAFEEYDVRPCQVTALVSASGPEFIVAFLAASSIGACAPLDPELTENEYRSYLSRLGARTLLVSDAQTPAVRAALSLGIRILNIYPDQTVSVLGSGDVAFAGRSTDAALLLFTSATTDSPKLVPLTWRNLEAMALHDSRALQLTSDDRLLSLMPLFHLHGLAAVLTQLSCGGSAICTSGFDSATFANWLKEFRPTWFSSSPPVNRAILSLARQRPETFRGSSLRFIRCGTAALDPQLLDLLEQATGVPVLNGYGSTETGGIARNTMGWRKSGSVGRSSGLELAVTDPAGNFLPQGSEGEIVVRGTSVTSGYLDHPETNEAAFREGWFRTGDLGRLDSDGFLFLTGRLKELINRGGEKISPQEIETVLMEHPAVADAAACAVPHASLGEDVAAAVVLREGATGSEQELRRFTATRLAHFKVPRRIVLIDSIPRTSTGKPRRGILSQRLRSERGKHDSHAASTVESELIDLWRRMLGVDQIGVRDDFFALGGDSLAAAAMFTECERRFETGGALLTRVDFFENPTIEKLARMVVESKPGADTQVSNRILPLRPTGSRLPFFCFPASAQDPYYLRHFSKSLDDDQPFFVVCHSDPLRDKRIVPVADLARSSVEAIRRQCPEGPYILGGHCYGGVVAYEAALQLMAQGQPVDCLVLFDAATPGYPKVHKQWRRYLYKAREMARALRPGKIAETASALRLHIYALGRIFARRRKASASRVLTAIGSDVLVAGREEKALNGMAMWEYMPPEFPAPIVHFIAADQPVSTEVLSDPRLGWNDLARSGIAVRHVKGDHNTILAAQNAAELAGQLESLLPRRELAHAASGGSKR